MLINTFLYSVYGQHAANTHATDPDIARYRHTWLDQLVTRNQIEAVIALGGLADTAFHTWRTAPGSAAYAGAYAHILHPTYPDSAAASGADRAVAMKQLTTNWNNALTTLRATVTPDTEHPFTPYGDALTPADLGAIPEADLPPGLPAWMRSDEPWAARQGATAAEKRATICVQVPEDQRPF